MADGGKSLCHVGYHDVAMRGPHDLAVSSLERAEWSGERLLWEVERLEGMARLSCKRRVV